MASPDPHPQAEDRPRCAVLGTLDVLRDMWTLAILRCVFYGIRRYTTIQRELGIATNVLADRLDLLVDQGILERVLYQDRPPRYEYHPTPKGADLVPAIVALRSWGRQHLEFAEPLEPLIHRGCGGEVSTLIHCAECGEQIGWEQIESGPAIPNR